MIVFSFFIFKMALTGSADVDLLPGVEATWVNQRTQGIVQSRTHTIVYPKVV